MSTAAVTFRSRTVVAVVASLAALALAVGGWALAVRHLDPAALLGSITVASAARATVAVGAVANGAGVGGDGMIDEGCARDAGAPLRDASGPRDGGVADSAGANDDAGASDGGGVEEDAAAVTDEDGGEPTIDESLVDVAPTEVTTCDVGAAGSRGGARGAVMAALVLGAVVTQRSRRRRRWRPEDPMSAHGVRQT